MSHAPGPWEYRFHGLENYFVAANGTVVLEARCAGRIEKWLEVSDANARLIAAAPELLEVCREIRDHFAYFSEWDLPIGFEERLDAALAKVEGTE